MLPAFNNTPLVGQQGLQQQSLNQPSLVDQQQQQQQPLNGVPTRDDGLLWRGFPNQHQNLQQYRPPVADDMGGGQVHNNTMLDLIRNQDAARQHNSMQQQHAFGIRPMSGMNGAAALQGQPGLNQRMTPAMTQDINRMRLQQALAARNPNLQGLQNIQTPPNLGRQLELMGLAHQQSQHQPGGTANLATLLHQQQQQQQGQQMLGGMNQRLGQLPPHIQNNFMSTPNMQPGQDQQAHASLEMINQQRVQQMMQQQQQQQQQNGVQQVPQNVPASAARQPMTQQQLMERASLITASIKELEKGLFMVQSSRQGRSDADYFAEINKIQAEIASRKNVMLKIAQAMHSLNNNNQSAGGNANAVNMNGQMQQPGNNMPNVQGGNWVLPNGQLAANAPQRNGQLNGSNPLMAPGTPMQQNLAPSNAPTPSNRMLHQPPRTPNTPFTPANAALQSSPNMRNAMASSPPGAQPPQMQPGMNGGAFPHAQPQGRPNMSQMLSFPALPEPTFNQAYETWRSKRGVTLDDRMLNIEGKRINLHALHTEVLAAGSVQRVTTPEQWAIIGGRIGFAVASDPPRCSPMVANQLQRVYVQYLQHFDMTYLNTMYKSRQQGTPSYQNNAAAGPSNGPPGPSMTPILQVNQQPRPPQGVAGSGVASLIGISDPQELQKVLSYAKLSADQMRQRGVTQDIIAKVEVHRDLLLRMLNGQESFRDAVKNQATSNMQMQAQQIMQNALRGPPQQQGIAATATGNIQNNPMMHPNMNMAGGPVMNMRGQQPAVFPQTEVRAPSTEDRQRAMHMVAMLREQLQKPQPTAERMIHPNERAQFLSDFERLYSMADQVDQKINFYACFLSQDLVQKALFVIHTVKMQRHLLSSQNQKFIIDLKQIRDCVSVLQQVGHSVQQRLEQIKRQQQQQQQPSPQQQQQLREQHQREQQQREQQQREQQQREQQQREQQQRQQQQFPQHSQLQPPPPQQVAQAQNSPAPQRNVLPLQANGSAMSPPRSAVSSQPLPEQRVATPQAPQASPRTAPAQAMPVTTPIVAKKKVPIAGGDGFAVSTPPAAASTPAASASTPSQVLNSPQTPKSPRVKTTPKTKPAPKRRQSTSQKAPHASVAPIPAVPTMPAAESSPSVSSPETGSKRRREETDESNMHAVDQAPSPKKQRADWDGPVSDDLVKKRQAVESISTEEDATKFFEQMTDLMKMAAGDGHEVPSEISDTLEQILRGIGSSDVDNNFGSLGEGSSLRSSSPVGASSAMPDGLEFFDFSSYMTTTDDDTGSKAATPDLIQAPQASPGSGSEPDISHHPNMPDTAKIADPKGDDGMDGSDPLRLGAWKEIDGGQSMYWQNFEPTKYDSDLPPNDIASWAFHSI